MMRAISRCFAASARQGRRTFAGGRSPEEGAEEEEAEEKAEESRRRGSQGMHLEGGANAYQVLGVSSSCSSRCIREAFTKLAKLTHPDLQAGSTSTSAHFILVLSAYQILSNPVSRAQYDAHLQRHSKSMPKASQPSRVKHEDVSESMEVVEWLRWYRKMAMTLVHHQHEIGTSSGFYDEFRANLHESMKRAYFGPHLDEYYDSIPDCFEAEERAEATEREVLHLVSGRKLIGSVLQVDSMGLLEAGTLNLSPFGHSKHSQISSPFFRKDVHTLCFDELEEVQKQRDLHGKSMKNHAFVDLELYLYGNLVARATRGVCGRVLQDNSVDEITVYLCHDQFASNRSGMVKEDMLLGTIVGLNTTESGGKGRVYSTCGEETHTIWQFKTPWVKHMHWFKVDGKRMLCECRSTRAHLPSSKFWLFEPRCEKHNIGGWYIETLWRNCSTVSGTSPNWTGKHLGFLHPAMYILGTAYKTLDTEILRRHEKSYWSAMLDGSTLFAAAAFRALQWCKLKLIVFKR